MSNMFDPWISVKERLPEHSENVLVCDARIADTPYIGIWTLEEDVEGGDCWNDEGGWWRALSKVTHWMLKPEAPGRSGDE